MKQQTLAMAADQNAEFERYRRPTRRDQFVGADRKLTRQTA
jgi:IS5 family transposase